MNVNPIARHRARCRDARAVMSEYLDGDLERPNARRLERHLRWCPNCRRMLRNLRRTVDGLHALGNAYAVRGCDSPQRPQT